MLLMEIYMIVRNARGDPEVTRRKHGCIVLRLLDNDDDDDAKRSLIERSSRSRICRKLDSIVRYGKVCEV